MTLLWLCQTVIDKIKVACASNNMPLYKPYSEMGRYTRKFAVRTKSLSREMTCLFITTMAMLVKLVLCLTKSKFLTTMRSMREWNGTGAILIGKPCSTLGIVQQRRWGEGSAVVAITIRIMAVNNSDCWDSLQFDTAFYDELRDGNFVWSKEQLGW